MKQRLKAPENDLYYWLKKDKQELLDKLDELEATQTRSQKSAQAQEGAKLIYNQDGWKVYHITTYEASVKYGKHTQWCISGSKRWSNGERGEEYFNDYTSRGIEFYFYIKNNDEKYALALTDDNDYEIYNQVDDDITDQVQKYKLPNVENLPMLYHDVSFIYTGQKITETTRKHITKIIVDDSVTSIGDYAFRDCTSLTSITIPDSVTSIGSSAFYACSSLTSITIPDSVTSISSGAFEDCNITSITIGNSITSISDDAFYHCRSLVSITIPDSVTSIGGYAFYQCSSLVSITIPDSVTSIGDWAFSQCHSLTNVYFTGTEDEWNAISIGRGNDSLLNANIHFNSRGKE